MARQSEPALGLCAIASCDPQTHFTHCCTARDQRVYYGHQSPLPARCALIKGRPTLCGVQCTAQHEGTLRSSIQLTWRLDDSRVAAAFSTVCPLVCTVTFAM
jgi:hypothetical protein